MLWWTSNCNNNNNNNNNNNDNINNNNNWELNNILEEQTTKYPIFPAKIYIYI